MVDIPDRINKKKQEQYADYLMQLQLLLATNSRVMGDENYKQLVQNLTKNLESEKTTNETGKFDRHAFEMLRFITNQGANFTGRG